MRFKFGAALSALAFILLVGPPAAQAATITVNTTADEFNSDGDCSLREAIQAANTDTAVDACTAGSGADTITVPAGTYVLSIAGANEDANATGDLDITADLTLNGPSAATTIIDGADLDRVFHIGTGITTEISGLTIQNGSAGGIGGGIANHGTLTVSSSVITHNVGGNPGGIFSGYGDVTLTIENSTVSDNTGGSGGGVYSFVGSLTITNSTISGNTAIDSSGGVTIEHGTGVVNNSTISGNTTPTGSGITNGGTLSISSSTVSGNTGDAGSGISNFGVLTLSSSTVAGNTGSSGIRNWAGTTTLKNTIVANSSPNDCQGTINSAGYNLIEVVPDNCTIVGDTTGNIIGSDPVLGALANNGGPTQTHALLAGSPAVDAVPVANCTDLDGNPVATDQRGVARPQGAACDIGAYEAVLSVEVTIDIKPGSFPNSWPCKAVNSALPVAVLSTATFDAITVDADSVRFGKTGTEAAEVHKDTNGNATRHVSDVNKDGLLDMVFHFRFGDTGFGCADIPAGAKSVTLTGKLTGTANGTAIEGADSLRLVR